MVREFLSSIDVSMITGSVFIRAGACLRGGSLVLVANGLNFVHFNLEFYIYLHCLARQCSGRYHNVFG